MIRNVYKDNGSRKSNAVQIDTRVSQLTKTGADFSGGNSSPVFPSSEEHVFDMYRDSDYLFKAFDPIENANEQKARENSANNAQNINPLVENLNNEVNGNY